jgi:hypothetical protein
MVPCPRCGRETPLFQRGRWLFGQRDGRPSKSRRTRAGAGIRCRRSISRSVGAGSRRSPSSRATSPDPVGASSNTAERFLTSRRAPLRWKTNPVGHRKWLPPRRSSPRCAGSARGRRGGTGQREHGRAPVDRAARPCRLRAHAPQPLDGSRKDPSGAKRGPVGACAGSLAYGGSLWGARVPRCRGRRRGAGGWLRVRGVVRSTV